MAEFKLDEKTRKSLMGLMPFSQSGTVDFTPDCFEGVDVEACPVFKHRAFNRIEFQAVRDIYADDTKKDKQKSLWEFARKTVIGWERVFDLATGELLVFKTDPDGGMDKEQWETLPTVIRREIFTNVSIVSGLLTQEKQSLK